MLRRRIERLEADVKPPGPSYHWALAFYRFRERRDVYAVRDGLVAARIRAPLSPDEHSELTRIEYVISECEADALL